MYMMMIINNNDGDDDDDDEDIVGNRHIKAVYVCMLTLSIILFD